MKLITLVFFFSVSYAQQTGDISFYFYGRNSTDIRRVTSASQLTYLRNTIYFNSLKPTVIVFHGWNTNYRTAGAQAVARAYLSRKDHNIVLVDWSKFSRQNYLSAVQSIPGVSVYVANILNSMKNYGLILGKTHLVGHSLGAQLSGMIGYNFRTTKNFKFCRITGLDPAGPLFWNDSTGLSRISITMPELGRNDAKFVDIIHTDADGFGFASRPTGHVDFWPNGGNIQSGCAFSCLTGSFSCFYCSHSLAWDFYAESVANKPITGVRNPFYARQCASTLPPYFRTVCNLTSGRRMGYYANGGSVGTCSDYKTLFYGSFYLETNPKSFYSKT